jgi:vacuolar protein sorting-associated protein 54
MLEIAALLEGENWNEVEIPAEFLQLIEERRAEIASRAGIPAKPPQLSAVASTLMLYRIIWDYVRIIEDLEVPSEANSRLIEAVKLFSSRSCQLVLGAGATLLGKVKTISSKMLGLSAQSLQFIVEELKFIQHKVHWKLPETDYDKVKNDLITHERLIFEKLASILNERFTSRCSSARSQQWESMLSPEQLGKDYYSQQISADLIFMHSNLHGTLSSSQLKEVFGQVFSDLGDRLTELYNAIPITSSTSAQRVVNDAQHLLLSFREKVSSGLQEQVSKLESSLEAVLESRCRPLL